MYRYEILWPQYMYDQSTNTVGNQLNRTPMPPTEIVAADWNYAVPEGQTGTMGVNFVNDSGDIILTLFTLPMAIQRSDETT